jgi:hypothetical protein
MKYKSEYSPSFLLDPVRPCALPKIRRTYGQHDFAFHPFTTCRLLLDANKYASFSKPSLATILATSPGQAASPAPYDPANDSDSQADSDDSEAEAEEPVPDDAPPGFLPLEAVSGNDLDPVRIIQGRSVTLFGVRDTEQQYQHLPLSEFESQAGSWKRGQCEAAVLGTGRLFGAGGYCVSAVMHSTLLRGYIWHVMTAQGLETTEASRLDVVAEGAE